ARALAPPRHALGEGRGAQHPGGAELDEHAALGVVEPPPREPDLPELVGCAAVGARNDGARGGVGHRSRLATLRRDRRGAKEGSLPGRARHRAPGAHRASRKERSSGTRPRASRATRKPTIPTIHAVVSAPVRSIHAATRSSSGWTRRAAASRPPSSTSAGSTMTRQYA